MSKRALIAFALALALPLVAAQAAPADVAAAVAAPGRPADAIALDAVRKPVEVLNWLGLKRGDRVLDYFTGTGYYAEIMARAVGPQGHVIAWNTPFFAANDQIRPAAEAVHQRSPNVALYTTPVTALSFPPKSFDFVLMHMVYHDTYWESARFQVPHIDWLVMAPVIFFLVLILLIGGQFAFSGRSPHVVVRPEQLDVRLKDGHEDGRMRLHGIRHVQEHPQTARIAAEAGHLCQRCRARGSRRCPGREDCTENDNRNGPCNSV